MPPLVTLLAMLLPAGVLAEEHIVDDQDGAPGFTTTGDDWTTWGMNGYGYDGGDTSYHYLSHTLGGDDRRGTATWQPELGQAGTWQIETWFRRTENRTSDADHVVTDGVGAQTWLVIDQTGDGASGWVSLGDYWCDAGFGGCTVTLDGTDDDGSDEANAVRFTLVAADGDPPETDGCDDEPEAGAHSLDFHAGSASGTDWASASLATGASDGAETQSPNVDDGEILRASAFDVCDPAGEETIDQVVLAVKARTQYDSGTYALQLALDASGAASTVFTGTSSTWHEVDVTGDQAWTWAALEGLTGRVFLYDHPGGARDSDAWVDAFRLRVSYTTAADEDPGSDDTGDGDDDPVPGDTGDSGEEPWNDDPGDSGLGDGPGDHQRYDPSVGTGGCSGCNVSTLSSSGFGWAVGAVWVALSFLLGARRTREDLSAGPTRSFVRKRTIPRSVKLSAGLDR